MRDWLLKLRRDLGMTQVGMAKELGIAQRSYSRFERGEQSPGDLISFFEALSKLSGRPAVDFFLLEMEMRNARTA